MSFDDLNLEFEDEDEARKKKKEAVDVDVDLEFQSPEGQGKPRPSRPAPGAGTNSNIQRPQLKAPGEVRKLDDARAAAQPGAIKRPVLATEGQPSGQPSGQPRSVGSSALKEESNYDIDSQQVVELRAQMKKVEFEAEVKVSVAEFKTEYLTEMLSDMKLMEHQIGQLLVRINAKHPDMKQEALMIKKILADFTAKKRK